MRRPICKVELFLKYGSIPSAVASESRRKAVARQLADSKSQLAGANSEVSSPTSETLIARSAGEPPITALQLYINSTGLTHKTWTQSPTSVVYCHNVFTNEK